MEYGRRIEKPMKIKALLLVLPALCLVGCNEKKEEVKEDITCSIEFAKTYDKTTNILSDYYEKDEGTDIYSLNKAEEIYVRVKSSITNPDVEGTMRVGFSVAVPWADYYESFDFVSGQSVPGAPMPQPHYNDENVLDYYESVINTRSIDIKKGNTFPLDYVFVIKSIDEIPDEVPTLSLKVCISAFGSQLIGPPKEETEYYTFR